MANLKIALTADTSQAVRGINQVKSGLQGVKQQAESTDASFSKLKTTIAGIATGAFVAGSFKMAQGLNDISKATGIALQSVVGFSQAIQANGGTVEKARDGLSDFTKNIGEAARGQRELQDALAKTGVNLTDLATLSEQDLLRKVIEGLNRIPDSATRSATAMKLFGESMKGVDLTGLANSLAGYTAAAGPNADAIRNAGEASANFQKTMTDVAIILLDVLKPLSVMVKEFSANVEAIRSFISAAVQIGGIVLAFTALGKVVSGVRALFVGLGEAFGSTGGAMAGLSKTYGAFMTQLRAIAREGKITGETFVGLGKRFTYLIRDVPILGKAFAYAAGVIASAGVAIKEFFNYKSNTSEEKKAADAKIKAAEDAIAAEARAFEQKRKQEAQIRAVTDAINAEVAALNKATGEYQANIRATQDKFRTETELIGASEKRKLQVQQLQEAEAAYLQQVGTLLEQYAAKSKSNNESDLRMLPEIQKAIQAVTDAYREQIGVIDANTEARVRSEQANQLRLFTIGEEVKAQAELRRIQDEINKGPMSDMERKYYDIAAAARESAMAAIAAEEARRGELMTEVEKQKYIEAATRKTQELIKKQRESYEQSRKWETGWDRAFKAYVDDATNAAKQAENIFKKATQGMEDAIVNFAKTGKFEWKSFVSSILEEMLRAQIQQLIAQTFSPSLFGGGRGTSGNTGAAGGAFGGGMGLGNIIGGIGNIFGGGGNQGGSVISGGGIGGGLGGGISGVIGSIGSGLGSVINAGRDIVSGIGDTIGSVIGGIGDFFGGFFANGGQLGAGKWGIAGEAGPELISGPATVTPLAGMGGSTNITYNINAVDAASFQQLVARDPQFIFAVTEQGRRSLPGGRR